jgi:hypothetical protein
MTPKNKNFDMAITTQEEEEEEGRRRRRRRWREEGVCCSFVHLYATKSTLTLPGRDGLGTIP